MAVPPNDDALARQYLLVLRDGDPPARATARRGLAAIFEARALSAEAVELLLSNAREGYRDAELFRTLARLYRRLGDEALAAEAALESAKYAEHAAIATHPDHTDPLSTTASQPAPPAHEPDLDPPSPAPIFEGHLPGSGYTRRAGRAPATTSTNATRPGLSTRALVLRGLGGVVVPVLVVAAAGMASSAPLVAACYTASALTMGLLASGWAAGWRLLRVPAGPLGTGLLGFLFALTFLTGGALTPRPDDPFVTTPTPVSLTATPRAAATAALRAATPSIAFATTPAAAAPLTSTTVPVITPPTETPPATASPDSLLNLVVGPPPGLVVANAGSEGARLRAAPGSGVVLKVLQDGARVMPLGEVRQEEGRTWSHVRDATGLDGWVASDFLGAVGSADATPQPATPAAGAQAAQRSATTAGQAQPRGGACPSTHPIKGNAGSMIYHVPSGAFYAKTYPEACFASEADARAAGYRRSQR